MTELVTTAAGTTLPVPPGFVRDVVDRTWSIGHDRAAVWSWLCDPATFTDSQLPPWRVEFLDPLTGGPAGFRPGVLTTHHGPLLHVCGVIAAVEEEEYRDLQYTYGAYALSLRLARPLRLEFWLDDEAPGRTRLRLRVTSDVRAWFLSPWRLGNRLFWSRFGHWCERSLDRR